LRSVLTLTTVRAINKKIKIMQQLGLFLNQLQRHVANWQVQNTNISAGNVGWHITHSLLVINAIIDRLETSQPINYQPKFTVAKFLVFTFKTIPRGKAKAPSQVQPQHYNNQTIVQQLQQTSQHLSKLQTLHPNQFFSHPLFGHINTAKAIKFLQIHTKHHLKIIAAITAAN
jgi:hypothetical protein